MRSRRIERRHSHLTNFQKRQRPCDISIRKTFHHLTGRYLSNDFNQNRRSPSLTESLPSIATASCVLFLPLTWIPMSSRMRRVHTKDVNRHFNCRARHFYQSNGKQRPNERPWGGRQEIFTVVSEISIGDNWKSVLCRLEVRTWAERARCRGFQLVAGL